MALTPTKQIPLGFTAPDFTLPEPLSGQTRSLEELKGKQGTLVMFICNHCPYVVHIMDGLIALGNDYREKGIALIGISSNDVKNYPADSPEKMAELAKDKNLPFAYLFDESQEIAKAYEAVCTPDFALFDKDLKCVYRGQFDGSRPGNGKPLTGEDMRRAFDLLLSGKDIPEEQIPSQGCNIKWK